MNNERFKRDLQLKIAEVQGWDSLVFSGPYKKLMGIDPKDKDEKFVLCPNWPTDRNASYELLHKMNAEDTRNATTAAQKHYRFILATHPAIEECLIYLWHEGWRWVECDRCLKGNLKNTDGVGDSICPYCSGDGGEWEAV